MYNSGFSALESHWIEFKQEDDQTILIRKGRDVSEHGGGSPNVVQQLLMQAGDVESNPGPGRPNWYPQFYYSPTQSAI